LHAIDNDETLVSSVLNYAKYGFLANGITPDLGIHLSRCRREPMLENGTGLVDGVGKRG